LLLLGLSVIGTLAAPRALLAHDPAAHASDEVSDFARVRHSGYELRLKLLPSRALAAHDIPAEPDAIRTALAEGTLVFVSENEGRLAQVGDMAFLVAELRQGERRIQNVHYSLSFQHIEDEQEVFAAETTGPDGRLLWGQQFFDGAEHRVTLRATPANGARFAPLQLELIAGVRGISPPMQVMVKSLLLLLAVVAAAMIVGYVVSVRLFAPSALRFSRADE
jgi:hypothetical protein